MSSATPPPPPPDEKTSGDLTGAIRTGERLVTTFGEDAEPAVRAAVSGGMINLADDLALDGRLLDAIAAGERLIALFGTDDEPSVRECVERARTDLEARRAESDGPHTLSEFLGG